ncbi:MAG: hypothetical protein A4E45_01750 [Methanosaeta sp. PtaB.Bin039]|nr:MAG: hypothetical protein A4E45_01750 [Methanosaeta sp. PtaB.Bin039]OPY47965.1 MAG: hypothetical protein A4E47_00075 [Methanosaeta sp. PtaU1.Bin028]
MFESIYPRARDLAKRYADDLMDADIRDLAIRLRLRRVKYRSQASKKSLKHRMSFRLEHIEQLEDIVFIEEVGIVLIGLLKFKSTEISHVS